MSDYLELFRSFAESDRAQAEWVDGLAGFESNPAKQELNRADAASMRAHADGWDAIANELEPRGH